MTIDWAHWTPWASLAGGVLLGMGAAVLVLFNARILGVSGILGGLLWPKAADIGWRVAFILGMAAAPLLWFRYAPSAWISVPHIEASDAMVVVAGLLVGWGTRLGSGCTSGHGVCGLARLSPRSAVATMLFMVSGFATVALVRHIL